MWQPQANSRFAQKLHWLCRRQETRMGLQAYFSGAVQFAGLTAPGVIDWDHIVSGLSSLLNLVCSAKEMNLDLGKSLRRGRLQFLYHKKASRDWMDRCRLYGCAATGRIYLFWMIVYLLTFSRFPRNHNSVHCNIETNLEPSAGDGNRPFRIHRPKWRFEVPCSSRGMRTSDWRYDRYLHYWSNTPRISHLCVPATHGRWGFWHRGRGGGPLPQWSAEKEDVPGTQGPPTAAQQSDPAVSSHSTAGTARCPRPRQPPIQPQSQLSPYGILRASGSIRPMQSVWWCFCSPLHGARKDFWLLLHACCARYFRPIQIIILDPGCRMWSPSFFDMNHIIWWWHFKIFQILKSLLEGNSLSKTTVW